MKVDYCKNVTADFKWIFVYTYIKLMISRDYETVQSTRQYKLRFTCHVSFTFISKILQRLCRNIFWDLTAQRRISKEQYSKTLLVLIYRFESQHRFLNCVINKISSEGDFRGGQRGRNCNFIRATSLNLIKLSQFSPHYQHSCEILDRKSVV